MSGSRRASSGLASRVGVRSRPELALLAALLVAYAAWHAIGIPGDAKKLQILFLAPIDALVIWAAWRASSRCAGSPRLRTFWLLVAVAWTAELAADLTLAVYDVALDDPTFPSLADAFFLAFYPLLLLALLKVPTARATRSQRLRIGLDCAAVVVGGGAAVWYFVLGPTVLEGGQGFLATFVSIAYPIGDLALLGALAAALVRRAPVALRLPLRLIACGLLLLIVADMIYGYGQLHGTYSPGDPVDTLYLLLVAPFVLAGAAQRRLRPGDPAAEARGSAEPTLRSGRLPLLAMSIGFGVLLATQRHDVFFPDLSLLLFALALAGLAAARQHVAQRELLQLQDRLQTIVDNVAEGIVTFSEKGRIIWVNPAAETYFGAEPDSLEGKAVEVLFEGIDWREMAPMVGVDGAPGPAIGKRSKFTGRRGDGSVFPAEIVVTEAQLDGERILLSIGQDVSERARAEAALKESERRFHGIFDNAGVGIAFSEFREGRPRIVDVNEAFGRMTGYAPEELRDDDFSLITHPDDLSILAEMGEAVQAGEDSIAREPRCMRKDGSALWGSLTVSILRDGTGAPRYAIGMLSDVTARKEAERVKDEFVSVVGHELRTPLTSIRGSLGLLEGGVMGELPEEAAQMLTTAVSNTDRLVRLINDILDIERIDSGRADIEPAPVAVAELVEQSVQVLDGVAEEAGVTIRTEGEDVTVAADADRIVQALVNLIGNAIKFSERRGTVVVAVEGDRDRAVFSVGDSGRGIPADKLDSIFDRFSQVDASDARAKGGTGLGLAIARSIVERHDGRIWAESVEGEGSTFRFTLPLAHAEVGMADHG
jgi:PAS domain S-box-containing protein